MAEQNQAPRRIPGVVAHLQLSDANAALAFYQKALDARLVQKMPAQDGKRLMHCHVEINDGAFMFADPFPEYGQASGPVEGVVLHISSSEPRRWWDRAVAAGMTVKMPLETAFWGDLYGQLDDPFGVTWGFVGPGEKAAA